MASFCLCLCLPSCTRESQHRIELLHLAARGNVTFEFIHSATPRECNAKLEGFAPLHVAAIYDNGDMVRVLIRQGARCNARTNTQWTPLHYASCLGAISASAALLDSGGDCNARDRSGLTPMHLAALHRHREVAELLVQKGANLNAKSKEKWTPLHLACQAGSADVVELLLASSADCAAANRRGWTALHVSAELGWSKIVRLLLCHGVAADKRTNAGWTALHLAAKKGRVEVIQTFVELCTPGLLEIGTSEGQNALHIAALHGHERAALVLISAGVFVYTVDKASCSPLSLASSPDLRQRMWQHAQDLFRHQQPAPSPADGSGIPTSSRFKVSSEEIPGENNGSATPTDQTVANNDQGKQARELERAAASNQAGLQAQLPLRQENCAFPPSSSKVKGSSRDTSSFSSRGSDEPNSERHHQGREYGGATSQTHQSLAKDSHENESKDTCTETPNYEAERELEEQSLPRQEDKVFPASASLVKTSDSNGPSFSSSGSQELAAGHLRHRGKQSRSTETIERSLADASQRSEARHRHSVRTMRHPRVSLLKTKGTDPIDDHPEPEGAWMIDRACSPFLLESFDPNTAPDERLGQDCDLSRHRSTVIPDDNRGLVLDKKPLAQSQQSTRLKQLESIKQKDWKKNKLKGEEELASPNQQAEKEESPWKSIRQSSEQQD